MRILLGVGGGIAAYKAAEIVRRLRAEGHEVRCAITRAGAVFVQPLTLEVLSGHAVYQEQYLEPTRPGDDRPGRHERQGGDEQHITAAQWAEVLVIAPATAHLLARLALGLADDFLTTTALVFEGPIWLVPAMHTAMWDKPVVQEHVAALQARGARLIGPVSGPLASGEIGMGRMAEPAEIARQVLGAHQAPAGQLAGKRVLVTAGPTHEALDPVRFLANRSSGRMGFALAAEAACRGAEVTLVSGPVALATPPGVERVDVESALQMERAVSAVAATADLVLMTAAVADFRPAAPANRKLKRGAGVPVFDLVANPDILAGLVRTADRALIVGFAAETDRLAENAAAKLESKGVDFLVANDVSRADIGFGSSANEVTVYRRGAAPVFLARRPKEQLAADLLDLFTLALADRDPATAAH